MSTKHADITWMFCPIKYDHTDKFGTLMPWQKQHEARRGRWQKSENEMPSKLIYSGRENLLLWVHKYGSRNKRKTANGEQTLCIKLIATPNSVRGLRAHKRWERERAQYVYSTAQTHERAQTLSNQLRVTTSLMFARKSATPELTVSWLGNGKVSFFFSTFFSLVVAWLQCMCMRALCKHPPVSIESVYKHKDNISFQFFALIFENFFRFLIPYKVRKPTLLIGHVWFGTRHFSNGYIYIIQSKREEWKGKKWNCRTTELSSLFSRFILTGVTNKSKTHRSELRRSNITYKREAWTKWKVKKKYLFLRAGKFIELKSNGK